MKKYIRPAIKVNHIECENLMVDSTVKAKGFGSDNVQWLNDEDEITSQDAILSKKGSVWDDEEE